MDPLSCPKQSSLLKLILNGEVRIDPCLSRRGHNFPLPGIYGFCSLENKNFPRVRLVRGKTLSTNSKYRRLLLHSPDLIQMSLLGAVNPKRDGDVPDLLYALTLAQPRARCSNIAQVSGQRTSNVCAMR